MSPPLQRCGNQQAGSLGGGLRRCAVSIEVIGRSQIPGAGVVALGNVKDALPLLCIINLQCGFITVIVLLAKLHTAQGITTVRLQKCAGQLDF